MHQQVARGWQLGSSSSYSSGRGLAGGVGGGGIGSGHVGLNISSQGPFLAPDENSRAVHSV
eukprot:11663398-Karenia_brevis.AAC.1